MTHLEIYTRLFQTAHDLKGRVSEKQLINAQILQFTQLAPDTEQDITEEQMKKAMSKANMPKMNQLVPALINIGYKPKQLEKMLETSQSNISHAKNNHPKREYSNFVFARIIDNVYKERIGKQVRYNYNYKPNQVYDED